MGLVSRDDTDHIVPCQPFGDGHVSMPRRTIPVQRRIGQAFTGIGGCEPVPVQHCHFLGVARLRVPPQEMVVVRTNFARTIIMTNVVIVELRERDPDQGQHRGDNRHQASCPTESTPNSLHHRSFKKGIRLILNLILQLLLFTLEA